MGQLVSISHKVQKTLNPRAQSTGAKTETSCPLGHLQGELTPGIWFLGATQSIITMGSV